MDSRHDLPCLCCGNHEGHDFLQVQRGAIVEHRIRPSVTKQAFAQEGAGKNDEARASITRLALRVKSSGSPGPPPMKYTMPFT